MMVPKTICLLAVVPATLLLTLSFFVLLSLRKAETRGFKIFGQVIIALLWVSALLIFSGGIYKMCKGYCPMMARPGMMHGKGPMMQGNKGQMMMKQDLPPATQQEK